MPINKFQTQVAGFNMPGWTKFFVKLDENPVDEDTAWQWATDQPDDDQLRRDKMKMQKKYLYRPGVHSGA